MTSWFMNFSKSSQNKAFASFVKALIFILITLLVMWVLELLFISSAHSSENVFINNEFVNFYNGDKLLGRGIKEEVSGNYLVDCLSDFDSSSGGQDTTFKVYTIGQAQNISDVQAKRFIENSRREIEFYRQRNDKVFSFVFEINFTNKVDTILENKVEFNDRIQKILDNNKVNEFFYYCGLDYIKQVTKSSRVLGVISFYEKDKQKIKYISNIIKNFKLGSPHDLKNFDVFNNLKHEGNYYLNLATFGLSLDANPPFSFGKWDWTDFRKFLKEALKSLNNSTGIVTGYLKDNWDDVLDVSKHCEGKGYIDICNIRGRRFLDNLYMERNVLLKRKLYLEGKYDRNYLTFGFPTDKKELSRIKNSESFRKEISCYGILKRKIKLLDDNYYSACRAKVLTGDKRNYKKIPECNFIREFVDEVLHSESCKKSRFEKILSNSFFSTKALSPVIIKSKEILDNLQDNYSSAIGTGVTFDGHISDNRCSDYTGVNFEEANGLTAISKFFPVKKKLFYTTFSAVMKIHAISSHLNPRLSVSQNGLVTYYQRPELFYKHCGTHYIDRWREERGIRISIKLKNKYLKTDKYLNYVLGKDIYNLDRLIEDKKWYVAWKIKKQIKRLRKIGVNVEYFGIKDFGLSKKLHPSNLYDFLKNKDLIEDYIKKSTGGRMIEAYAIPWNNAYKWYDVFMHEMNDFL